MRITPCYDVVTKQDCPRRSATCRIFCPEWKKYVEERDKEYERRYATTSSYTAAYTEKKKNNLKFLQRKSRKHGRS